MANITGDIDLSKWLGTMYSDYQSQSAKKDTMFGQGISAMQDYADIFKPGGSYGAGTEAMIARGGEKAVASGMQNLVSAGLSNTTMPMHLSQTFEEEVGMPTRLASRDRGMELYGNAMGSLGQMYAGYNPVSPSGYGISSMATGGFGTMMQGRLADMNLRQQMNESQRLNQAGLASTKMFGSWGSDGGGSGSGGGGGGGGGSGFSNPYSTGPNPYTGSGGGGVYNPNEGNNIMGGLFQAEQHSGGLGTFGELSDSEQSRYGAAIAGAKKSLEAGGARAGESPQTTFDSTMAQIQRQIENDRAKAA